MRPFTPEQHQDRPTPAQQNRDEAKMRSVGAFEGSPGSWGLVMLQVEIWAFRGLLLIGTAAICYRLQPGGLPRAFAALAGFVLAVMVLVVESRSRQGEPAKVLGGAIGAASGILVALFVTLLVSRTAGSEPTKSCVEYVSLFSFGYLGLMVGASRGEEVMSRWGGSTPQEAPRNEGLKLLDTSVLIDGRIADISDAHFLDGVLGVPQFVLHELQMVADSSDPLKRQRGRRGLEVLQRMQKMEQLNLRILEQEATADGDVDDRLVELAKRIGAKIVTNDFNLNKVATVRGIAVLNVNLLANAMKPAVLPGEPMRVLILREGKEPSQGVAYLDDGTMVVVDGARRMINKSVDVVVTSVHQTTAGKMIFGRIDERTEPNALATRQAAAGVGPSRGDAGHHGGSGPSAGRLASSEPRDEGNS